MKTHFYALIFACSLASPLAQAGGILVFDATAKLENVRQWQKEASNGWRPHNTTKTRYELIKDQLATATGVRDIASFVDQAKSLKADLEKLRKPGQALNDLLLSGGSSGQFDALYEKYKIFDTCNAERSGNYANVCKQQVINKAIQLEQTDEIQNQVSQTLNSCAE
jgi:type IV secretion system protein VirB5